MAATVHGNSEINRAKACTQEARGCAVSEKKDGIFGLIGKAVAVGGLAMGGIYVLFRIANPVVEQVGQTIGNASRALNIGRGNDFHSIAVLCIIIIGVIGVIKAITRRK
jgi:hypothetical protein